MPAQVMPGAIPMYPNSFSEFPRLGDELLARHCIEIGIHGFPFATSLFDDA
jgi:hypothetical protein